MQTATAKFREAPASGTRRRILDVAALLLRDRGYAGTTVRDIADGCGIKPASLYHHFASKDEILAEVFDYGIEQIRERVEETLASLPKGASFESRIRAAVLAHLEAFFRFGDYTIANIRTFGQAPKAVRARNRRLRVRYENVWRTLFEEGQKQGRVRDDLDVGLARLFLIGAMNATVEWYDRGRSSLEPLANEYATILLHGVEAR
jgi:AcrR family transcriptional regulator